jgi:membrane-bound metal-dependent hydrolase YbcI (DUF457 family)
MASFRGHLTFSVSLGAVYGGLSYWQLGTDWGSSALAAGLTAIGGMLPDLDSDSGRPVRELFGLAAVFVPLILLRRLMYEGLTSEQILVICGIAFLVVRYGLSAAFKRLTVHRGMFHSIPAMLIAGLMIFLGYHHHNYQPRAFMAIGVMIGFLSHLVLDEICSVDFRGLTPRLNKYAGSALKLTSPSRPATILTYALLAFLGFLTFREIRPLIQDSGTRSPMVSIPSQNLPLPPEDGQRRP